MSLATRRRHGTGPPACPGPKRERGGAGRDPASTLGRGGRASTHGRDTAAARAVTRQGARGSGYEAGASRRTAGHRGGGSHGRGFGRGTWGTRVPPSPWAPCPSHSRGQRGSRDGWGATAGDGCWGAPAAAPAAQAAGPPGKSRTAEPCTASWRESRSPALTARSHVFSLKKREATHLPGEDTAAPGLGDAARVALLSASLPRRQRRPQI